MKKVAVLNEKSVKEESFFTADIKPAPKKSFFYSAVKRIFDIAVSLAASLVLALPMIAIGMIIRIDSPGPAIFKQDRLGKNGKQFTMYKFRSMHTDAENDGPMWAQNNDERCTKFGKIIRKNRIDELPQLYNIIKGDMSIVGPRPERACFYEEFERYIPGFKDRLGVIPGLTGHAQVNGGYDLSPEEKLKYDMEYIEKRSLFMDLLCVLKTVKIIFSHSGAR